MLSNNQLNFEFVPSANDQLASSPSQGDARSRIADNSRSRGACRLWDSEARLLESQNLPPGACAKMQFDPCGAAGESKVYQRERRHRARPGLLRRWRLCYILNMRQWMRDRMKRRSKRGPNESESTGKIGQEIPTDQPTPLQPAYPEDPRGRSDQPPLAAVAEPSSRKSRETPAIVQHPAEIAPRAAEREPVEQE